MKLSDIEPQEPTVIGVDLASGPDITVFTCSKCGEIPCEHYEVVNELP